MRLCWQVATSIAFLLPVKAIAQEVAPEPAPLNNPAPQAKSQPARARGPYVSVGGGALQTQDFSNEMVDASFNLGASLEVAVGYDFGAFRADLSYIYGNASAKQASMQMFGIQQNLATTGSIQTNSIFLNGYYVAPTKKKFKPYVGAGAGYTRLGCGVGASGFGINYNCDRSSNTLGYQAKLGFLYQSTDAIEVFAEGVYRGMMSRMAPYDSLDSFGFQAGVRYRFPGEKTR